VVRGISNCLIEAVAATDVAIAIFGESGTGKELVARTIHRSSPRRDAPFVVVNCAAIPAALLEDELFGHVRGAFTDASKDREGLIAAAAGGTLFLDEIGELPILLQAKLLRFLQSHEIRRIGDNVDRHVDVRIVTATNRDLLRAIAQGEFREDLYYRIAVFAVQLPPLRDRPEDIPLLAHHIIGLLKSRVGRSIVGLTPSAVAALARYPFPGNVRELENKLHHAMVVARSEWISVEDLALPEPKVVPTTELHVLDGEFRQCKQQAVAAFETRYVAQLMSLHRGSMTEAAKAAGLDRKQLWSLLKKAGLNRRDFKP
jgi:transcriptional regulator with PAS, ATPase and Fis domain